MIHIFGAKVLLWHIIISFMTDFLIEFAAEFNVESLCHQI